MPTSVATLKLFRQLHLYVGVFIAPAILFFAFTGAIQTFSLHETTQGSDYKPPAILVTLAQLHKKQTTTVPVRKSRPDAPKSTPSPDARPTPPLQPAPPQKSHLPMKVFFLLVAVGLFTSTLTGLYMSYKYANNKLVITAVLLAGIIIPLLLLPF